MLPNATSAKSVTTTLSDAAYSATSPTRANALREPRSGPATRPSTVAPISVSVSGLPGADSVGPGPAVSHRIYADRIDWHQIARLVQRGCPPGLALRIVR